MGDAPGAGRDVPSSPPHIHTPTHRRKSVISKKKRHVNALGETIYKGHSSYDLMLNIQLGIRWVVGIVTPGAAREVRQKEDFRASRKQRFPREGTSVTPAHNSINFKFKDYAPMVFRHLREKFQIDPADYMLGLCGDDALRELSTPGKSGAILYYSENMKYVIKTVSKHETKFLRAVLPNYYNYVMQESNTLLTRFFGLHRVRPHGKRPIRFVVMGNVFGTNKRVHVRYDVKGSTVGRSASDEEKKDPNVVLKDLDFDLQIDLRADEKTLFKEQLFKDAKFLSDLKIMDYSLLIGIHFPARSEDASLFPLFKSKPRRPPPAIDRTRRLSESRLPSVMDTHGNEVLIRSEEPATPIRTITYDLELTDVASPPADFSGSPLTLPREEDGSLHHPTPLLTPPGHISFAAASPSPVGSPLVPRSVSPVILPPSPIDHPPTISESSPFTSAGGVPPHLARGVGKFKESTVSVFHKDQGGIECRDEKGNVLFMYLGVIDILQTYNTRKQLEHVWKSLQYDKHGISAVSPHEYATRFVDFLLWKICGEGHGQASGSKVAEKSDGVEEP